MQKKMSFMGKDLLNASSRELRAIRGKDISMIFQDPMTSLNPFLKIGEQIIEPLQLHTSLTHRQMRAKAIEALEAMGISEAEHRLSQYPHEFSGGMRQRVMIATALINRPKLLIADEPTTALDVTVQAQVLALLQQRCNELGTGILFITHDLGVVAGFCNRVAVMYAGKVVEEGPTESIFYRPQHPYTQALERACPSNHTRGVSLASIPGGLPSLIDPPIGCRFAPRCAFAKPLCSSPQVQLKAIDAHHSTACIRVQLGELATLSKP